MEQLFSNFTEIEFSSFQESTVLCEEKANNINASFCS